MAVTAVPTRADVRWEPRSWVWHVEAAPLGRAKMGGPGVGCACVYWGGGKFPREVNFLGVWANKL